MAKLFNVSGPCNPQKHYMVNLESRLHAIKAMVDAGEYFTINRARQYGKTTTLHALTNFLGKEYIVICLDFQRMSSLDFNNESSFVNGFSRDVHKAIKRRDDVPDEVKTKFRDFADDKKEILKMAEIFDCFCDWCEQSEKPVVLIIDEVDTASNNQVFLDFLAQLRAAYIDNDFTPTFQSVILAGVTDVRSIKRKIRPDEEHRDNSPWNIAAKFRVDMSFSADDIKGMLEEYEADYHTGMDIGKMAQLIYDYTSGYPYLVSLICKLLDEEISGTNDFPNRASAWTKDGFLLAVKMILEDNYPLFDSLVNKLNEHSGLKSVIVQLLFQGESTNYDPDDADVRDAMMFGFVKVVNSTVQIANRIFEMRLYNMLLKEKVDGKNNKIYSEGKKEKDQFVVDGHLNMRLVLEKFVTTFDFLYGDRGESFLEDEGRRYFMLFLKPIINGTGNCYVEAQTRNRERMDLVIDYHGEQSICELKIWRGNAYNERGEEQLTGYLDYFGLKKGYMLSFNFNKNKEIGVKDIVIGDKVIIEAVV